MSVAHLESQSQITAETFRPLYDAQSAYFKTGITRTYEFRRTQLKKLESIIRENESQIAAALYKDLRKHPQEAYMTETGAVLEEIKVQLRNLKAWMRPKTVTSSIFLFPAHSYIVPDPLGTVLVISPWNYPILLTLRVVAGAIAAGNTLIIKPSELSPNTSELMASILNEAFPKEYLHVLLGEGATVLPGLLEHFHFDHVMYTGSTSVGKKIMAMAAKQLSPVTLELGGKSPCVVEPDANLKIAAKRIVWGKLINAGQSCVAPDYILVHESIKTVFIETLIKEIERGFGTNPQKSSSYARIINQKRFNQLLTYLQEGTIVYGGQYDASDLYIAPTILENIHPDAGIMKDELFGPLLPVFTYKDKQEALDFIDRNPYPLAFYLFTSSTTTERYFMERLRFGGGAVNETILQLANSALPYGGVGYSGHGRYLGKYSFDTFTHYKGIVKRATWFEPFFRHAPFHPMKTKLWRFLLGRK